MIFQMMVWLHHHTDGNANNLDNSIIQLIETLRPDEEHLNYTDSL